MDFVFCLLSETSGKFKKPYWLQHHHGCNPPKAFDWDLNSICLLYLKKVLPFKSFQLSSFVSGLTYIQNVLGTHQSDVSCRPPCFRGIFVSSVPKSCQGPTLHFSHSSLQSPAMPQNSEKSCGINLWLGILLICHASPAWYSKILLISLFCRRIFLLCAKPDSPPTLELSSSAMEADS